MRSLYVLTLALLATAANADPLFYALTGATAYCDSDYIWQYYTVSGTNGFHASAGDDGSCPSVWDGRVINSRGATFESLQYRTAYSDDFPYAIVWVSLSMSGPDLIVPPTDAGSFELTAPVTWHAVGSGRRDPLSAGPDYIAPDYADFSFSGSGTGVGYFDFVRRDGVLRVTTITYGLVAAPDPVPEPASILLLAVVATFIVIWRPVVF